MFHSHNEPSILFADDTLMGPLLTLRGDWIGPVIAGGPGGLTPHTWTADVNGQFHTTADLAAEWQGFYQTMLNGHGDQLTAIQRLEGNAEAVFENTAISTRSASDQRRFREDAQRQFDAMAGAMSINQSTLHIDPNAILTVATYVELERTLQTNAVLSELAVQGHGLNNPPNARYRGYTGEFQNNVDHTTLYIGGGLDRNQNALTSFFDDIIMTHTAYGQVWNGGVLQQLNQNGAREDHTVDAVISLDDMMFYRVLGHSDFSQTAATGTDLYISPAAALALQTTPAGAHEIVTLSGRHIADTITITPHSWTADVTGLFHTTTDLGAEWRGFYQMMLAGQGSQLTAIQRLEGNAEAAFENTALAGVSAVKLQRDREDVQRQFDAMAAAMSINQQRYGIDPTVELTAHSYLMMERTMYADASLEELGLQGHGLNNPPSARYRGYTNDFQNGVDHTTTYIGGGLDNGENALTAFFDDVILGHTPFVTVWRGGTFIQLNQNGNREDTLADSVSATNDAMFHRVYTAADFKRV